MAVEYNPRASLLPDNPGVPIQPVQAGGAFTRVGGGDKRGDPPGLKPVGWRSTPQSIPVNPQPFSIRASPTELRKLGTSWTQSLGPNIPSRRRTRNSRGDRIVINALLNAGACSIYLVAPLRGDTQMASDIFHWAHQIRVQNPKAHIIFSEPIASGSTNAIYQSIRDLASKHPGGIFLVGAEDSPQDMKLPLVDGVRIIHPEISRSVTLGFIPDEDIIYQASERMMGCAMIQTSRISQMVRPREAGGLYEIIWRKPVSEFRADKEPKKKSLTHDVAWSAPPGWVTEISYISKNATPTLASQMVGGDASATPAGDDVTRVTIGIQSFKIRKPTPEVEDEWKASKFTGDEKSVLDLMELPSGTGADAELQTMFLKGLAEEMCGSEANTMLKPECGVFRYIMALRYYDLLQKRQAGTFTPILPLEPPKYKSTGVKGVEGKTPEKPIEPAEPGAQPGAQPTPSLQTITEIEAFITDKFSSDLGTEEHNEADSSYPTVGHNGHKFGETVNGFKVVQTAGAGNCFISALLTATSSVFRKLKTKEAQNKASEALRPLLQNTKNADGLDLFNPAQKAQICKIGEFIEDEAGVLLAKNLGYNLMLFQPSVNSNIGNILVPEDSKLDSSKPWILIYSTGGGRLVVGAGSHYSAIMPKADSYTLSFDEGKAIADEYGGSDKAQLRAGKTTEADRICKFKSGMKVNYEGREYTVENIRWDTNISPPPCKDITLKILDKSYTGPHTAEINQTAFDKVTIVGEEPAAPAVKPAAATLKPVAPKSKLKASVTRKKPRIVLPTAASSIPKRSTRAKDPKYKGGTRRKHRKASTKGTRKHH